jgi:phosphoribosylanthranilate isomerase
MGGFVKICGMNDSRAVQAALDAGADAIGFVFARSVRQVSPEQAAALARPARGRVLCVAVTRHPAPEVLEHVFAVFRPDVLQTDREDFGRIRLPSGVEAWPVLRGPQSAADAAALHGGQRALFEGLRSGSGEVADWSAARDLAARCSLILAGGLSRANVAQAIDAVHPYGVDVSSGVEEAPGRKNPELNESFVSSARAAFARVPGGEH